MTSTYTHFELIRSGQFSPQELAVIMLVASHRAYCFQKASTLGRQMQRSDRTVRNTINKLVKKGVLTKKYSTGKVMILKLVDKASQIALTPVKSIQSILSNLLKKKSDRKDESGSDRKSDAQPRIKETFRKNSKADLLKKVPMGPLNPRQLDQKRSEMLAQFQASLA